MSFRRVVKITSACKHKKSWGLEGIVLKEVKLNKINKLLVSINDYWLLVDCDYTEDIVC